MITTLAQSYGEEQRDKELEAAFYKFMALPAIEQTFIKFKQTLVTQIEQPSNHKVKCKHVCVPVFDTPWQLIVFRIFIIHFSFIMIQS